MARPRTVSDDAILQAARDVFVEAGPQASTTIIAQRVGLSQAALFKRFGTKRELMIAALLPPAVPPFAALLDAGPTTERPIVEQLNEAGQAIARFFRDMVPCLMVLRTADLDMKALMNSFDVPPPLRAQMAATGFFARAMEQGLIRPGDPLAMTGSFLGAIHMRAFFTHLTDQPFDDEALDGYVDSVVQGLWRGMHPEVP